MDYKDIGLPIVPGGDVHLVGLAYCPAASAILAAVASVGGFTRRFFVRDKDELSYRELLPPSANCRFYKDLAVATDAPLAFVMLVDDQANAMQPYVLRLPDGQLTPLPAPTGYMGAKRTWISQILSCSPDATSLHVVAAAHPPPQDGVGYSVTYSLARMTVSTGHLDKIVDLPTPFA